LVGGFREGARKMVDEKMVDEIKNPHAMT